MSTNILLVKLTILVISGLLVKVIAQGDEHLAPHLTVYLDLHLPLHFARHLAAHLKPPLILHLLPNWPHLFPRFIFHVLCS